ncbi:pseudouridylate synthase TRUB1 isoform X3 [Heteronotia binoei]|uniref:pseudouridylate synthase TRUB1 isoform X3 n=1 Tax=Heteronotia binoei TaxID=13085 RepID=UPI00292F1B27|nr:pseudouridylate synthase TRUB1 isoform X3 [Heteronotia binoei]
MAGTMRGPLLDAIRNKTVAAKLLSFSGLFAVHKPKGPTSADVLNRLKAMLLAEAGLPEPSRNMRKQILKIGHGGILDSAATGVLDQITKEELENVLQKFTGSIMQVPPLYSALKKDGQRLSTLITKGKTVEAKPARPVIVYSLSLKNFKPPLFTLDVECSGGFYVRSLVNDIGRELSSCASVQELTRTKQGPFTLEEHALYEDKWTIDEIAQSLEHCMPLLSVEPSRKKLKTELSEEHTMSCEDK